MSDDKPDGKPDVPGVQRFEPVPGFIQLTVTRGDANRNLVPFPTMMILSLEAVPDI